MIFKIRFLTLFATTSLMLNNVVAGDRQLRGARSLQEGDTDPCNDLPGSRTACTTLEDLVAELKEIIPRKGDEYNRPKTTTLEDWQKVIGQMLEGQCRQIDLDNYPGLNNRYKLYRFVDTKVIDKPKDYCVFTSTATKKMNNVDRAAYAWGTFITRIRQPDETIRIFNLSIDVPHPLADSNTYEQGITIYKYSQARSMYLAGSHRETDPEESDCGKYNKADASHNYQHPLTYTTMAVEEYWNSKGKDFAVIQIHGKDTDTCQSSDVFVADGAADKMGKSQNPGTIAEKFKESLETSVSSYTTLNIDTLKSNSNCNLGATQNIQARLINGIKEKSNICNFHDKSGNGQFIENPNGKFLQIEQSSKVREDTGLRELFGDAIRNTFDDPKYYRTE